MGSYYRHTRSEKAEVPYSFQCEQCGKSSGPLRAVITGTEATENSHFKKLNPDQEERLRKRAHDNLVHEIKEVHTDAVEKHIFSTDFHDQCPFCNQSQSWAVSGLKKKMFQNPLVCLGVGTFFAVVGALYYYFGDAENMKLSVAVGIFVAGVVAAAGCMLWNVIKIQQKVKKTSSGMRNTPVIDWNPVQNLLNE